MLNYYFVRKVKTLPEMKNRSKIILERTLVERQRFFISDLWRITTRTFEFGQSTAVCLYTYRLSSTFFIIELQISF